MTSERNTAAILCAEFSVMRAESGAAAALAQLTQQLEIQPAAAWIECAQTIAAADEPAALAWLHQASVRWPQSIELRYWLATALWNQGELPAAERELRQVLAAWPQHAGSMELLAKILRHEGRLGAAARLMFDLVQQQPVSAEGTLRGADFIRHCQRQCLAAQLCDVALQAGLRDPAICAQAGLIALELGRFDAARAYLLEALERGVDVNTWLVFGALAFAQKYTSAGHPDFQRFATQLENPRLAPTARASTGFALAKACDDIGEPARAAQLLRVANAQVRALKPWSAARYQQQLAALLRVQRSTPLPAATIVPIFVVGLPRSGTTLAAVMLGRQPNVRDRGELPHLAFIAERLAAGGHLHNPDALREAAALYYAHLRQDDEPAGWYIDKTPTNFLRLDLIATLFPQAHVVLCRRNRRDTALSLYSQHFAHADGDFSYAFADIAAFAEGHDRLMEHCRQSLPLPIHVLDYEQLVQHPDAVMTQLLERIGIHGSGAATPASPDGVIGSASLWQAKQPVYTSSIGRWRAYASALPELQSMFPDETR